MTHAIGCVKLSEHHGVSRRLPEVPHPEFSCLEVWRVDDKLLKAEK